MSVDAVTVTMQGSSYVCTPLPRGGLQVVETQKSILIPQHMKTNARTLGTRYQLGDYKGVYRTFTLRRAMTIIVVGTPLFGLFLFVILPYVLLAVIPTHGSFLGISQSQKSPAPGGFVISTGLFLTVMLILALLPVTFVTSIQVRRAP